jgi:hypothetical protein
MRMIDLLQITNDPAWPGGATHAGHAHLWVDLERMGKAERQAGRNTFHQRAPDGRRGRRDQGRAAPFAG